MDSLGKFTVRSVYLWLDNGGVISKDFDIIWYSKIPLKNLNIYVAGKEK
jgi:hypothetical protein